MDEKPYQNTSIYDTWHKTFIGAKSLCVWFVKVDEFIRVSDGTRYLVLFGPEKYDAIYNRLDIL